MSKRSSILGHQRFLREGFSQILEPKPSKMGNPNDATIDIPLTTVTSRTGARQANPNLSPHIEKPAPFGHSAGGRRRVNTGDRVTHRHEEEDTLTRMGRIYNKVLDFSIVTRYFLYILPLALIIAVPIIIGATAAPHATLGRGGPRILWFFTWVEIVWLSLWVSKLASKALPSIFQFLCGIVSSGTRKYALVIESLEIPLSLCGWALASLATFLPVSLPTP